MFTHPDTWYTYIPTWSFTDLFMCIIEVLGNNDILSLYRLRFTVLFFDSFQIFLQLHFYRPSSSAFTYYCYCILLHTIIIYRSPGVGGGWNVVAIGQWTQSWEQASGRLTCAPGMTARGPVKETDSDSKNFMGPFLVGPPGVVPRGRSSYLQSCICELYFETLHRKPAPIFCPAWQKSEAQRVNGRAFGLCRSDALQSTLQRERDLI